MPRTCQNFVGKMYISDFSTKLEFTLIAGALGSKELKISEHSQVSMNNEADLCYSYRTVICSFGLFVFVLFLLLFFLKN